MPKAIKKKSAHKKEVDTEIQVKDSFEGMKKVFEQRQKSLVSYGLVALSAAIVIGGIAVYRFSANDKARQLEYDAYKAYYNIYQKTPLAGQDKAQKALELFQQAYEKKKSPRVLLFIADAYAEMAKYDEALKTLDEFTQRFVREEALIPLAYQKMVVLQLKKGSRDEALKTLDRISAAPGDMLKDFALIQKARMLEQDGKKDEAIVKYKELAAKYPQSPYVEEAKTKSGEKKAG
ncbi:MAG: tetratricopeptide repeat protein [Nitrospirae bacterium]|nr:tetratricopeptide repeat protein [Nitrospirota bacterium]